MKFEIKNLSNSEIEIKLEISAQEFEDFYQEALKDIAKEFESEGFRRGKAPLSIVEEKTGEEKILTEAAEKAISENYKKIVLEEKLEPISQPKVEILKFAPGNPLVVKISAVVLPKVNLPDYKKIAGTKKRKEIKVEEKEVEDSLNWLVKSRAKFSQKQGPAEKGDFVEIIYWSDQIPELKKGQKDAFILDNAGFIPGFEDKLLGMKAGEEKEFSLTLPPNYRNKNLAGKKVDFKVKIEQVQKVDFPKLDDEFVRSLGRFSSFEDLKKNIREGLGVEKEKAESFRLREEIIKDIREKTEVEIPKILIEKQQEYLLKDFKSRIEQGLKISFSDYLKQMKKTEQEMLNSFYDEAERRTKDFLILWEISKRENIQPAEEEVEEEANKILRNYKSVEEAEKNFSVEELKKYVRENIRNEKVFSLLESLALK